MIEGCWHNNYLERSSPPGGGGGGGGGGTEEELLHKTKENILLKHQSELVTNDYPKDPATIYLRTFLSLPTNMVKKGHVNSVEPFPHQFPVKIKQVVIVKHRYHTKYLELSKIHFLFQNTSQVNRYSVTGWDSTNIYNTNLCTQVMRAWGLLC